MTILLSTNVPRVAYTVGQGVVQKVFAVPFEFFDDEDVTIYVDGIKKTLGSNYTLSGGNGAVGTLTFNTTGGTQLITGATGGSTVIIVRDVKLSRVTDFATSGDINRTALNLQLDTLVAQISDMDDRLSRTIQLNDFEVAPSMLLTADRKDKILAFNASTGNVEAGPSISAVNTAVTALSTTTTKANEAAASATSAASSATTATAKATIATDKSALAATAKTNAETAETNAETAETNAASSASTALTRANAATASASTATTKASEASSSASSSLSNKNATDTAKANAVTAQNASVAARDASVTAKDASVAAKDASVVAKNASVAAKDSSVTAQNASVAAKNSSETAASNSSSSASTATTRANTATAKADIATAKAIIATDKAAIATTKASEAASSASSMSSSVTAATAAKDAALAALDSFDDRYLGPKSSNPSVDNDGNSLVAGTLYFNSTDDVMKVYEGSNWVAAYASVSGALLKTGGAMTGAITTNSTFDGRDVATDGSKLDSIEASATADQTKADIQGLGIDVPATNLTGTIAAARLSTATTQAESDDSTKIATTAYVVDKITTLIGGAPSTLNSLNELAAAINDDASYNSTLTTALATKLPKAGGTMTGNLTLGDNNKAIFGAGSDLQIYHDGSNSYIKDGGTGQLRIDTNGTDVRITKTDSEFMAKFIVDGAAELYHNNAKKIETTSAGATVTGTVTATAFAGSGANLTGVGGSTTLGAVGTYTVAANNTTNSATIAAGATVAGSTFRTNQYNSSHKRPLSVDYPTGNSASFSQSGTWRNMAGPATGAAFGVYVPTLWVRIS